MKPLQFLLVLVPLLLGLLLPTIAFHVAQHDHAYVPGQDEDLDSMVAQAESALPFVTAITMPGFLGLAIFLLVSRNHLTVGSSCVALLVGTGSMAAIVLAAHSAWYDLLYSRGRMGSTAGVGIVFVSAYCLIAAMVTSALAWYGRNVRLTRKDGAR